MSSFVYYKFKSQKAESRVAFDGTGISVFDLKKEIILSNSFGKATDVDLLLFDSSDKGAHLRLHNVACATLTRRTWFASQSTLTTARSSRVRPW